MVVHLTVIPLHECSKAQARMDILERLVAAVQALRLLSKSNKSVDARQKTAGLQEHSGEYLA